VKETEGKKWQNLYVRCDIEDAFISQLVP